MTVSELKRWRDFLSAEILEWGKSNAVHPLCDDPELFEFQCITDALLAGPEIEAAVEHFIARREWPGLSDEHTIYLLHRAVHARNLVNDLIAAPKLIAIIKPPPARDRAAVIRWLFVQVWDLAGADYMKRWVADYLKTDPPPSSA